MFAIDLTGVRVGRLLVLKMAGFTDTKQPRKLWLCQCDCGTRLNVRAGALSDGRTNSCGCLRKEMGVARGKASARHGEGSNGKETVEYRTWSNMLSRCNNTNHAMYKDYGAHGIKVCERWHTYEHFLEDVGRRPTDDHSLDRVDNSKGYGPDNFRWATSTEQNRNMRGNTLVTIRGQTACISDWAELFEMSYPLVLKRLLRGWEPIDALMRPPQGYDRTRFKKP